MRIDPLLRILFILYCLEAGLFLFLAPWSPLWVRAVSAAPDPVAAFFLHPLLRGGVSGFGLVHLIWGLHDTLCLLRRKRREEHLYR